MSSHTEDYKLILALILTAGIVFSLGIGLNCGTTERMCISGMPQHLRVDCLNALPIGE